MKSIGEHVQIAPTAVISDDVIIGNDVVIEEGVFIDTGCIIRDHVRIEKGTRVGARCILGEYLQDFYENLKNGYHPLVIGENSLIRSETIIYGDCQTGECFQTGHRVTIRENSRIGKHVRVGTLSDIQGHCAIGNYVNMHSNVHIAQMSRIHDYVWIFPYVVLTNDPQPPSMETAGVEVHDFAVIATGSVILPGVQIGKNALIGAGSTVTRDVPEETVAFGNPAKQHGSVRNILNKNGERAYPWCETFERGMPWMGIGYEQWKEQQENQEAGGAH